MTKYNKQLVSIDVFDTAIFRRFYEPTDLFRVFIPAFFDTRIKAEKEAQKKEPHYSIYDIYSEMPEHFDDFTPEIKVELENCYANPEILEMYKKGDADYIFISDMYLPRMILEKMLISCGYDNPRVFVSCECNAHKADGSLFKYAENVLGRKISCHYGDNYAADILGAKKAKIQPVFNPALHNIKLNLPMIKNSILKRYIAETETNKKIDKVQKLARFYAPIMLEFTKWVLKKRQDARQGIFFISRDMFIPYFIAKNILKAENIHYIHASRKSLAPIAVTCDDKKLNQRARRIFTKKEIENCIATGTKEIKKYFAKTGIKNNDIFVDIGYAGTIQYCIENLLNIKLQGLYMQTENDLVKNMNTDRFFRRDCIAFYLLVEFPFCSPENNVRGYKDGKPIFLPDSLERRKYSAKMLKEILSAAKEFNSLNYEYFRFLVDDLEQILIHLQYYADAELLEIYNRKIFANRKDKESIIKYDREEIAKGNLFDRYCRSYCKPLFKKMLAADKEYSHLSKLLEG